MSSDKKIIPTILYLTIFPIVLPASFYLLGLRLDRLIGNECHDPSEYLHTGGVIFIALGGIVVFCATIQLWTQGKGLPLSSIPPKKFVQSGIYSISRHPVYLGAIMLYGGLCLLSRSFWCCCVSWPLLILFFAGYAMRVEEPVLLQRYGTDYKVYRNEVALFIPSPFKKILYFLAKIFLAWLSRKVNRPFIIHYHNHLFFLGYGLWCGLGVMSGLALFNGLLRWQNVPAKHISILLIIITLTCLAGIRIIWITGTFFRRKGRIKPIIGQVGFVSWGVLLGTLVSGVVFILLTGRSLWIWLDMALFSQMLTHFFGRIGCLFYGCCYGKESLSDLYLEYHHPALKAVREKLINPSRIFPVQIYSAGYGLVIFLFVLVLILKRAMPVGLPAGLVCILYSTFRFLEEWCRVQKKHFWDLLSPSQLVCIFLFYSGMASLFLLEQSKVYQPLLPSLQINSFFHHFQYGLLLIMGLLSTLIFSYHQQEIGRWMKDNTSGGE